MIPEINKHQQNNFNMNFNQQTQQTDTNLGGSWDQAPDERRNPQCLGRSQGRHGDGRATMNSFSATVLHEAASSDKISEKISDASDKFSKEKGCQEAPVSGDSNDDKPVKENFMLDGASGGAQNTSGQGIHGQEERRMEKQISEETNILRKKEQEVASRSNGESLTRSRDSEGQKKKTRMRTGQASTGPMRRRSKRAYITRSTGSTRSGRRFAMREEISENGKVASQQRVGKKSDTDKKKLKDAHRDLLREQTKVENTKIRKPIQGESGERNGEERREKDGAVGVPIAKNDCAATQKGGDRPNGKEKPATYRHVHGISLNRPISETSAKKKAASQARGVADKQAPLGDMQSERTVDLENSKAGTAGPGVQNTDEMAIKSENGPCQLGSSKAKGHEIQLRKDGSQKMGHESPEQVNTVRKRSELEATGKFASKMSKNVTLPPPPTPPCGKCTWGGRHNGGR